MSKSTELPKLSEKAKELRAFYEADLFAYMCYVNPGYMYDDIHKEFIDEAETKFILILNINDLFLIYRCFNNTVYRSFWNSRLDP